jgi:hypothetical protein
MAVRRPALFFWASAVLAATAFALLTPYLLPYGRLGLVTQADREKAWLVTVFCAGVMAVLFGTSASLGTLRYLGVRDVMAEGDAVRAIEKERRAKGDPEGRPYTRNFGLWTVATGVFLIAIYFGLWLTLR